jgi:hypothetical protein
MKANIINLMHRTDRLKEIQSECDTRGVGVGKA